MKERSFILHVLGDSINRFTRSITGQYYTFAFGLVVGLALITTGCPKPKSTTVNANCSYNTVTGALICTVGGTVVFDRTAPGHIGEEAEIIVDVPDGWALNTSNGSLDFHANSNSSQPQIIGIPLTVSGVVHQPIGTGSSTVGFRVNEATIETGNIAQSAEYESTFAHQFSVEQTSCELPSGEYVFHFRYKPSDFERVTYLGSATIVYEAGADCSGSSVTVK